MKNNCKIKVYYNSACPVCNAGIEKQKNRMEKCEIEWKDIDSDNALVNEINADLKFVRERLHVIDDNGNLYVGLDAFIAIWGNSPSENWKANILRLPVIKHIGRLIYNLFAAALYKWNQAKKHW
ncbi:Predicted thiol-disulfide oxidoreductase YuxK, DCC family [Nitrosomonas cryotolerans]|uniref:Predicted thiol-disulfide oxidoreductase YuxK, DCC family n=1 Tax=Nitrosomonas cryotolerans ATCC 49181 TaxID=1131553 RepID=A0A1N6IPU2_9PROT|nr:DUF393 domain-containing protein [Nitrosomonas cryotolerans]SFP35190.1 Predicted thiol-disulfide oxidoreductase YuxK, DCC family [Nitrosomonas cryotolerans]SIO33964.1 Predicted thiol-disulfide oxidoreductase YuxK, DCC family [Nitrosomonas cryotolerans ATCC 49181]